MRSKKSIQRLIYSIDRKIGAKTVNLSSAVKILCNGYSASKGNAYTEVSSGSQIESCQRISKILDTANKCTGYNDTTLTSAVQRLCDGYAEDSPLYSFGVLSDLHIQYGADNYGGVADLQRAFTYLRDRVAFTCIPGDLVAWAGTGSAEYYGTTDYMAQYKATVDGYAGDMPVYECAGNHETYPEHGVSGTIDTDLWRSTTGKELYYSFTYGNDVFAFLSLKGTNVNDMFADGGLEWLEELLEANKGKRCFVFRQCPELADRSADPSGTWSSLMEGISGKAFIALMKKYRNTIWFHGHTHVTLGVDEYPISEYLGYRSVHVPSLVSPRFYDVETNSLQDYYYDENNTKIWGSLLAEGYIVDVYANKIVLRGINFAEGENRCQVAPMTGELYVFDTTTN